MRVRLLLQRDVLNPKAFTTKQPKNKPWGSCSSSWLDVSFFDFCLDGCGVTQRYLLERRPGNLETLLAALFFCDVESKPICDRHALENPRKVSSRVMANLVAIIWFV